MDGGGGAAAAAAAPASAFAVHWTYSLTHSQNLLLTPSTQNNEKTGRLRQRVGDCAGPAPARVDRALLAGQCVFVCIHAPVHQPEGWRQWRYRRAGVVALRERECVCGLRHHHHHHHPSHPLPLSSPHTPTTPPPHHHHPTLSHPHQPYPPYRTLPVREPPPGDVPPPPDHPHLRPRRPPQPPQGIVRQTYIESIRPLSPCSLPPQPPLINPHLTQHTNNTLLPTPLLPNPPSPTTPHNSLPPTKNRSARPTRSVPPSGRAISGTGTPPGTRHCASPRAIRSGRRS